MEDVPSNDSSRWDALHLVRRSQLGLWHRSQVVLGVRGIAEHLLDVKDIVGVVEVAVFDYENRDYGTMFVSAAVLLSLSFASTAVH